MNNNKEIIGAFQVINKIDGVFTKMMRIYLSQSAEVQVLH